MSALKKFIKECINLNQLEIENLNTKIFDYYKRTKETNRNINGSKGENNSKTEINFKYISKYITFKLIKYLQKRLIIQPDKIPKLSYVL